MIRWIKAWIYKFTGLFGEMADDMQMDKHVMAETYNKSIKKAQERQKTVSNAVAELMTIESNKIAKINELTSRVEHLEDVKSGAQAMLQELVQRLRSEGMSKEDIQSHPEYIEHSAAFNDADSTIEEIEGRIEDLEEELRERKAQIAQYTVELQQMQRENQALQEEKHEAIADVAVSKQAEALDKTLAGIANDSSDNDLQAAREARKRAKSRAKVSARMSETNAKSQESQYLNHAKKAKSNSKLDSLLDFGDEGVSERDPAQLPE